MVASFVKQILNQTLLLCIEGHNANTLPLQFRIHSTPADLCHGSLCFHLIATCLSTIKHAIYMYHPNLLFLIIYRRECIQFVAVKLTVAETNQAFMTTPVMPEQMGLRHSKCKAVV